MTHTEILDLIGAVTICAYLGTAALVWWWGNK
ncbi:hypothetical protein vB_RpoS-V16_72 [Ruegeria phage vB_RpoS-V16]|nr:hypothetical protein JT311_gp72 [Ruegeria phage vB_RpoS-V16]AWY09508.1 hypothetical protein vB_RpoS-V16_72 [Ruegeria phage vB_RpoS-V16]